MSEGIAYQNKDIISKVFTEYFGCKSLEVYGLIICWICRMARLAYLITRVITRKRINQSILTICPEYIERWSKMEKVIKT